MIYLIAGLICSALVSLVLKFSAKWDYDRYGMFAINYTSCLIPFIFSQIGKDLPPLDENFTFCFIFALVNGILYLAGMLMNQINVKRNGAILQSTFARLGVMVPTAVSIIFFGERPSLSEAFGIVMVLAAFCIMNIRENNDNEKRKHEKPVFSLLILGMLFGGIADSALKIFEQFGSHVLEDWFMGLTFLSASIICLLITVAKKGKIGKREIITGLCLGIPNYLSSLLLLKSLSSVSAYIAYPTYSVGAILVVTIASTIFFREKLSKWSKVSFALIIPAVILLNL